MAGDRPLWQPEIVAVGLGLQRVFDARNGLPAAAVAELKRATRLALSPHDERHAVLAYWVLEPYLVRQTSSLTHR